MTENRDSKNNFNGQDGTKPIRILANGKRVRVIDLENYSETNFEKGEDLIKKLPDVEDLLKARFNKYWGPFGGGLPKINPILKSRTPIKEIVFDDTIIQHDTIEGEIFEPTSQKFKMLPNKRLFRFGANDTEKREYNKNAWKAFITNKPQSPPDSPKPKGPLPSFKTIVAVPTGRNQEGDTFNFNAKLSWTFLDAQKVTVFREEGDRLTQLTEDEETILLEGSSFDKREKLREIDVSIPRDFAERSGRALLRRTLEDVRNDARENSTRRRRELELQRRFEELPSPTRTEPEPITALANGIITSISGFQTFRFVAENEAGTLTIRQRIRGTNQDGRLMLTPDLPVIVAEPILPSGPPPPKDVKIDILPTINEDEVFFDHAFDINIPFSKKALDKVNAPIGSLFADVQPNYNFFIDNYEQIISSASAPEPLLPNLYAFLTELRNENTDEKNTIFRQHITLAGTIPDVFIDITNQKGEKIGERDRGQYFDKYARAFGELMRLKPDQERELIRKFTNLITPISNIDLFKEFNEKRELFPMFFDINFSTDKTTQFAEILMDSQLSNLLVRDLVEENIPAILKNFQVSTAIQQQQLEERSDEELQQIVDRLNRRSRFGLGGFGRGRTFTVRELRSRLGVGNSESITEEKELEMWDITDWVKNLSENPLAAFSTLDAGVFLGTYNDEIRLAVNSQFDFFKNFLVIIFAGKLKGLVERELRTFEEILQGKLAYSETAFYKIEKRDAVTGELLQNFFLPNSNDINIHRFIDTQVKYNKQYTYEIFAYQLVIGNKYNYEIKEITEDDATIEVFNMPSIQLVKVSYHEFTGRILDSPPVFPDVNVIPFRAVNNKIKFNFNSNVGEYKLEPIIIEPEDEEIIKKLREAQRITEEEFLRYAGDDRATAFEIFRLTKRPRKFQDFTGNRIALVETDINSLTVQAATAGAFIDNIMPNKKYYYVFRTIDNHGHISNPTPIYELEIVDNDGTIFPIVKTIEFDMGESAKVRAKTARKFIQIIPAFQQTLLNEEKSGLVENGERAKSILDRRNFHLGVADEQVWKKNFKIRLISRKTGKKLDLNVDFGHKNIRKEDNQGKILDEGPKK